MSKKKTLIIGISIIVLCLLVSGVYMVTNRSVKREPTAQEIEAYAPYTVDWQVALGTEGTDKERILGLCTFTGEETIGENVYQTYASETLGEYLYHFGELSRIALLEDTLYIQYTTADGNAIMLAYNDGGLCEKGIYDAETDTFFYELDGVTEVWSNFRNGIQWGA